jgi:hypothetical protein
MHLKQGQREVPLSLSSAELNRLRMLVGRAGALARDKQRLTSEEARIKDEFEKMREDLERKHGLEATYAVVGEGGQIQVALGETFVLHAKYEHPDALRAKLTALDATHLIDCFSFEVKPDQRSVKDRLGKELLSIGALEPKKPTLSLRAA